MKRFLMGLLILSSFGSVFAAKEVPTVRSIQSKQSFDEIIAKGNAIVDFYADWCGPCKRMAPDFCALAEDFPGVTFLKVNIDHAKPIADRYSIRSIPTIIFFKDGKEVERTVGKKSKKELRTKLKKQYK